MSNIEAPVLLTRQQAMQLVGGVSYDTFRRLLDEGVVPPGIQFGARLRWDRDALIEHLKARISAQKIGAAAERASAA